MRVSTRKVPAPDPEALYNRFLGLLADFDRRAFLEDVLFHPVSLEKLNTVAAVVIRGWKEGGDRHDDLMQEAALNVVGRFHVEKIDFMPRGVEPFLGWLWTLWYNACLHCLRDMRRDLRNQPSAIGRMQELPQAIADGVPDPQVWPRVLQAIHELPSAALRDALNDWAYGLNGAESAKQRGLSEGAVSKRRSRGVALLRKRLPEFDDLKTN